MNAERVFRLAAALATVVLSACIGPHDVQVEVSYDAPESAPVLMELALIAGSDKSSWPSLTPGDRVSVVLKPEGSPPQLTVLFARAGERHAWEGPRFPVGKAYKIRVSIDGMGRVSERH
jgi:hypothetical protein